jgi:hypothetical protein
MKVKNAMQAFPFIEPQQDDNIKAYHPGMTMRDEFAKAAMQVFLQNPETEFKEDAEAAYLMADHMMKARAA